MIFNPHPNLEGQHAFLGASKYHWINYDESKLISTYSNFLAVQRGTELHEFAYNAIRLGIKLPNSKKTLNAYINDAIGFKMSPEVVLRYSDNCFGTADAISFNEKKQFLRIHDLKTGSQPAHMEQLLVYTALFCLEYRKKPIDINAELRIYQNDDIIVCEPTVADILPIMDKIIAFDKVIDKLKEGER